jgi:tetratricopeptide (TPR) repeat protein
LDAARLAGRLTRRRAEWAEAERWFDITQEVAKAAGLPAAAARALVGLGGVKKELGNLPAARARFLEALAKAEESRDGETIALVHHGLLGVEQAAGNLAVALGHGWVAIRSYVSEVGRIRCVASLGGALLEMGDLDTAEDAWSYVAFASEEHYYLVYAQESLAHICALRGDRDRFLHFAGASDALGWGSGTSSATAEWFQVRGESHRALGELDLARDWFRRAVAMAETYGFNRILFEVEEALRELDAPTEAPSEIAPTPAAPLEVREGLRAMRREVAAGMVG